MGQLNSWAKGDEFVDSMFGWSVAISSDGSCLVVGAPGGGSGSNETGSTFVFDVLSDTALLTPVSSTAPHATTASSTAPRRTTVTTVTTVTTKSQTTTTNAIVTTNSESAVATTTENIASKTTVNVALMIVIVTLSCLICCAMCTSKMFV